MDLTFMGKSEKGIVVLDDEKGFTEHIKSLDGKFIQLVVRRYRTNRSNNQNRYYFGIVIKILGDELGYMPDEMHEALKWKFLRKGGKLETVKSTSSLTTIEFEQYLELVRIWALRDLGINIPLPNEVDV